MRFHEVYCMHDTSKHENRGLDWWKSSASYLARILVAIILIGSGIGLWFNGEIRELRVFNERLSEQVADFTKENEKLSHENSRAKQIARDRLEVIEELKEQNFKLSVENTSLSARDDKP